MNPIKYNFYTREDNSIRRIHIGLAKEVGLNESIVLLQIDHLINITGNKKIYDGRYWTYDSAKNLKEKYFPFWGVSTIKAAISSLKTKGLIIIGNYNKLKIDKTNWYTIDYEKAAELTTILIGYKDEGGCTQPLVKIQPTIGQNSTNHKPEIDQPIPETSPEISPENSSTCTPECNVEPENIIKQTQQEEKNSNSYSFLKQNFVGCKLFDTLCNRNNKFSSFVDFAGNVNKFRDRSFRYKTSYGNFEYWDALKIYDALPDQHKIEMTEYIDHETKKWDFSKTNNEEAVKGRFILEYILWHPVYQHFQVCKREGLLQEDIDNFDTRHPKAKGKEPFWGDIPEGHFDTK